MDYAPVNILRLVHPMAFRAISDRQTMKDWFTLKLQECVYISHQRHQSTVPNLVKLSGLNEHSMIQRAVWAASVVFNGVASNTPDFVKKSQESCAGALKTLLRELPQSSTKDGTAQLAVAQQRSVSVDTRPSSIPTQIDGSLTISERVECLFIGHLKITGWV